MRALDLLRLAAKSLGGKGIALPILGFAVGAFCLCAAGTALAAVEKEKAEPFEFAVSARGKAAITDADLVKITRLPGVRAATALLPVAASVKTGSYEAELTLTGIDAAYLGAFGQGGAFPSESVMPYIVLNSAACRQFSNGSAEGGYEEDENGEQAPLPSVDWLNATFTVRTGGARPAVSKVCGILAGEDEGQQPAAYISLSLAKQLLKAGGQSQAVTSARVRAENIGAANGVARAIEALGLAVADTNAERQARWDVTAEEAGFVLAAGLLALAGAAAVAAARSRLMLLERKEAWEALRWAGMRNRDIRAVLALRYLLLALIGIAAGVAVAVCLPSFLPPDASVIFRMGVPGD